MRTIRIIEHISLDGVIQGPGGPDEDRDGGFDLGGWSMRHADPAVGEAIVAAHGKAFDLLLGRRTYDIWSGYWPKVGKSPMADSLNAARKYIATHRPDSLEWGPVEDLGADIVEGIRNVKVEGRPSPDRVGKLDADARFVAAWAGRRGPAARLPRPARPGKTLLPGRCRRPRTLPRQHQGRGDGRAHQHVSSHQIAADRVGCDSGRLSAAGNRTARSRRSVPTRTSGVVVNRQR